MSDSLLRRRERRSRRRSLYLALLTLTLGASGWLFWMGTSSPRAELRGVPEVLGREGHVSLRLEAPRAGLRSWQAYVRDAAGKRIVIAEENLPGGGLFAPGIQHHNVELTIDPAALGLAEGPAEIIIQATGHAPLSRLSSALVAASAGFRIDRTPPRLRLIGDGWRVRQGGTGLILYEVDADATSSGVQVGETIFPGEAGGFPRDEQHAALYTVPWNASDEHTPRLFAQDAAGNRSVLGVPATIRPRTPRAEKIRVSDSFIERKIHPLLESQGIEIPSSRAEAYLAVNRDMRAASEVELRGHVGQSAPMLLVEAGLRQQPGTQVGSRFAEHRTYMYEGRAIDEQTHLGYDLASVRRAPVEASGAGRVQWVGDLGIYGKVVLIDHGLGLATLYAHLSTISVASGDVVARGTVIGRTGETGLAGGDHLHFSVTIRGHHVDPIEWWDARWVEREIHGPLRAATGISP
ncbi:MAG: M23 family metallopeptidase [Deltaproteobacteria bacterium]